MKRLYLFALAGMAVSLLGPARASTYCDERITLCPVEAGAAAEAKPTPPVAQRTGKTRGGRLHAGNRPLRIVPFPPERVRLAATPAVFPMLGPVMALAVAEEAEAVVEAAADHSDVFAPAVEPLRALRFTLDTAKAMRALAQIPTSACLVEQSFEDLKAAAPFPKLKAVAQLSP